MSLNGTVWAPIGPSPLHASVDVNGQVTSIAVNPNDVNVLYIGTAWGGIWRTRDGGTHWTPPPVTLSQTPPSEHEPASAE